MEKISRESKAATIANSYEAFHDRWGCEWKSTQNDPNRLIWEQLKALGDRPSPEAVNQIIGNDSWTTVFCESHMGDVEEAIRLSSTDPFTEEECQKFVICKDCLIKSLQLLQDANSTRMPDSLVVPKPPDDQLFSVPG